MKMPDLAIVMPVYNEGGIINIFLDELERNFGKYSVDYFVVDDASLDSTREDLSRMSEIMPNLSVFRNETNLGHGPSMIKALTLGQRSGASKILSIDGDGQFYGIELLNLFEFSVTNDFDVIEGIRTNRKEPFFRKVVSLVTRLLIYSRTRKATADANTPARIYRNESLDEILGDVHVDSPIPNLHISAIVRVNNFRLGTYDLKSRQRLSDVSTGSTWGKGQKVLPNKRFLQFCKRAIMDWFK